MLKLLCVEFQMDLNPTSTISAMHWKFSLCHKDELLIYFNLL